MGPTDRSPTHSKSPNRKDQYVAAVKALDTYKEKSQAGKAIVYLTKADEGKKMCVYACAVVGRLVVR